MGLVASSAPWGWRRQRRIDGGIGRIGLDWLFIKHRLKDPAHRTKFSKANIRVCLRNWGRRPGIEVRGFCSRVPLHQLTSIYNN